MNEESGKAKQKEGLLQKLFPEKKCEEVKSVSDSGFNTEEIFKMTQEMQKKKDTQKENAIERPKSRYYDFLVSKMQGI